MKQKTTPTLVTGFDILITTKCADIPTDVIVSPSQRVAACLEACRMIESGHRMNAGQPLMVSGDSFTAIKVTFDFKSNITQKSEIPVSQNLHAASLVAALQYATSLPKDVNFVSVSKKEKFQILVSLRLQAALIE